MNFMFDGCINFNIPLNNWNVSNVRTMKSMFAECESFNLPLDNWIISQDEEIEMDYMFSGCTTFNQPLNSWNVENVISMEGMFSGCSQFNQPLNNWNVSNVINMNFMFQGCIEFDQPLNDWVLNQNVETEGIFHDCVISLENIPPNIDPQDIQPPIDPIQPPNGHMEHIIAYGMEVHNMFGNLNIPAINQFLTNYNQTHRDINPNTIPDVVPTDPNIFTPLITFIDKSNLFSPAEKEVNKENINNIKQTIYNSGITMLNNNIDFFKKVMGFVCRQNDNFIEQYIRAYRVDCLNIANGLPSCVKGMVERILLIVDKTAEIMLLHVAPEIKTYIELRALFPNINFTEVVQEWATKYLEDGENADELKNLSIAGRKAHFINFMRQRYGNLLTLTIDYKINEEANTYLGSGVFERLAFGGKRNNSNKSRKNKLLNKKKRTTKRTNRKHKKTNKRNKPTKENKRNKSFKK